MGCFNTQYAGLGRVIQACDMDLMVGYSSFYVIVVTGEGGNKWGHTLLNLGNRGGYYVQVSAGLFAYPTLMNEQEYQSYLIQFGKKELMREFVYVPNPAQALLHLEKRLGKEWLWLGPVHNCATFVEEVVKAGGGLWNFYLNIPCGRLAGCQK